MRSEAARLRWRNLRTLAALAGLFLLPLVLAFVFYYGSDWRPAGHVNHGQLILPPRALPKVALERFSTAPAGGEELRGVWSLTYLADEECEAQCRRFLYLMRQTRLSLNTDMTRVARVLLQRGECASCAALAREDPGLIVLAARSPAADALLAQFPAPHAQQLYLVDPLGNLMMSYDARQDPHGLLEDLKKLLRLSQIG